MSVLILRVKFSKDKYLKYISHLDLLRLFDRMFRIIGLPIDYTEGYNPRPRFSVALPLPLGVEGYGEYLEIHLVREIDIDKFLKDMNEELPEGMKVLSGRYTYDRKATGYYIEWADYEISFSVDEDIDKIKLENLIESFLARDEVLIEKTRKRRKNIISWNENILPLIDYLELKEIEKSDIILNTRLKVNIGNLKPEKFLNAFLKKSNLNLKEDSLRIKRLELLGESNGEIHSIFKDG